MNEDLKPCYDIESNWELVPEGCGELKQVYRHKDYHDLFRVIDFKKRTIEFRDTMRVTPANVIDIYKNIGLKAKAEIIGLVLRVIHEEKPILMPYAHEELKVFTEYHANTLGILYYKDSDDDKSIVPIRRYFKKIKDNSLTFEEISWSEFVKISTDKEAENVDQTQ